ncbi:MAG TPA: hypothetical protein DEV81_21510 [Cyanobacteria bacterium UBA11049]|nr:hypothetical protein [Cyanobacteria bacterium UBA11049]
MLIKQSISLLVLSAFLVLPNGIAQAGSVDVQTGNMRTTIDRDRDVKVKNGSSTVTINRDRTSPKYRRDRLNSRLKRHPWTVRRNQNTCNGGSYSSQSTQTTVSNNGVTRTRSSESTVCN